jgi:phage gp36-like protein
VSYATQQDLVDRFGEQELIALTDRADPPAGAPDATTVAKALADADAEIDGYLIGRYTLPLAATPKILVLAACDLARYRLYEDRATEQVRRRYEDQVKFLRAVADGKIALGPSAGGDAPAPSSGGPQVAAPGRVFTRGDGSTPGSLDDY